MAVYKKGQKWTAPFSPDFDEVDLTVGSKYNRKNNDYNPAAYVSGVRSGNTGRNVQEPAPFSFQDDTVDVDSGVAPATHIRGGFPSAVSRASNHPGYKKQPR